MYRTVILNVSAIAFKQIAAFDMYTSLLLGRFNVHNSFHFSC